MNHAQGLADLHVHLEGAIPDATLRDIARKNFMAFAPGPARLSGFDAFFEVIRTRVAALPGQPQLLCPAASAWMRSNWAAIASDNAVAPDNGRTMTMKSSMRFPRKRGGIDNRGRDARETEEVRPGVS